MKDIASLDRSELRAVRARLGVTQAAFGLLCGVHAVTVARWESGVFSPTPYQAALIRQFGQAPVGIGPQIEAVLATHGVARAVYQLLNASFKTPRKTT